VRVLTVNAGSSSLKLSLLDEHDRTLSAQELDAPGAQVDAGELEAALCAGLGDADAVGHRIVHGGARFSAAVRIDDRVERQLRELVDLAPLHQPKSLAALDAVTAKLPELAAVACFDTAFHASLPAAAATYALPAAWRERWGLRRYGFHGLSHAWVARRVPEMLAREGDSLRIVSCHLGAGASLCAIADGRSLDTTMGFTPLEGLTMATRSGSVDPGMLLWLMEREGLTPAEMGDALEHRSGLLGLSGSADMREVLERAREGDKSARDALAIYVHRLRAGIAAMTASLGGIDALAFTGTVGERSSAVRKAAVDGLAFLGLGLDEERNTSATGDREIGAADVGARVLVIAAREDLQIAGEVRRVLGAQAPPGRARGGVA
jgi:acetate kinase